MRLTHITELLVTWSQLFVFGERVKTVFRPGLHVKPGKLYATAVSCFTLSIPNRYLPILQEGKIEGLTERLGE